MLALIPAAMLLSLLARRVWDVDIFWQLKLGELILAHHGPVRGEPFSALHLGDPLPAVAWLGQAVMASVRLLGGWALLRLFDALCWLGGFWAAAAACRARGATIAAIMLALALAFYAALPTASIRPQSFAVLCFGLLLALQRLELRVLVTLALGAPLLVLWQNLHPSVSVGVLAMGVTAVVGWLRWLRDRRRSAPWAPTGLALIGCAAMFATPDGISVLAVSARNAEASIAIGASEWLPLWIPANHVNALPVMAVTLIALGLALRHRDRVDAGELAVALVLLLMTVTAYRFVLFWAVSMVPVLARIDTSDEPSRENITPRRAALVMSVLAVAVLGPILLPTRFMPTIPLAALERLKRENVKGTVYGDFPFGGAIIDVGYPAWHVAYDGRYYRYSSKEWRYNGGIENGFVPLVDVERKWRPAAFVLNAHHNAPIARELARSRRWRRIYAGDGIVAYVPRKREALRPRALPERVRR
ncbi:hypothetical protein [Novosphingobium mangrovi (ex Huang et al. 2023)]|uniref:Glycosyltransferase RgtA/B/C/D-like domain-containing protein n=1 Tax=Novosphingobium mangrovi (ex Huang et al. 2023) TaxID=2976432 RepID=A0ABT2I881_9SPHN|nr:hypothetical protein [Novosphingobium mangrovi (ex Huang et al. 2023)]MCT2401001.1 hypothetical protein [Novosphingobium mangrovi (ex Huang et al. 2023)]